MPESMSGGKKSFQESSKERTKNSKNPYTVKAQMVGSEANSWSSWLKAVLQGKTPEEKTKAAEHFGHIRSQVLAKAHIRQGDTALDVGTGTGLLAFGAANQVGSEGRTIGCDIAFDCLQECRSIARKTNYPERFQFTHGDACNLPLKDASVDVVLTRSRMV